MASVDEHFVSVPDETSMGIDEHFERYEYMTIDNGLTLEIIRPQPDPTVKYKLVPFTLNQNYKFSYGGDEYTGVIIRCENNPKHTYPRGRASDIKFWPFYTYFFTNVTKNGEALPYNMKFNNIQTMRPSPVTRKSRKRTPMNILCRTRLVRKVADLERNFDVAFGSRLADTVSLIQSYLPQHENKNLTMALIRPERAVNHDSERSKRVKRGGRKQTRKKCKT